MTTEWAKAGVVSVDRGAVPPTPTAAIAQHPNTVMGLDLADAGVVATIDFDANWRVWRADDLGALAAGRIPSTYGRGIAIAPNGKTLAVLTCATRTHYTYDVWLIDVASGQARLLRADAAKRCAWTTDGRLVLTSTTGYRIYSSTGDALDTFTDGGWWAAAPSATGERIYCIVRHHLHCLRVADRTPLPAPDLAPFAAPPGHYGWSPEALALSPDGTMITAGDRGEVFLWHATRRELFARLSLSGLTLVGTRARFDHGGAHLVVTFNHVRENYGPGATGSRVTHVVYDGVLGHATHALTKPHHTHGDKSIAALTADSEALLVAHGNTLQRYSLA